MADKKRPPTVQIARELMEPVAQQLGLELWDVRFEKEGSSWYLRYFIDKEGGVTIQDCEAASKAVDVLLDEADPIDQSYILEVCSPGIERELSRDWHYRRCMGRRIKVRLIRPVDGVREFVGTLLSREGDEVAIALEDDVEMRFGVKETAFVRLYADFETGGLEG